MRKPPKRQGLSAPEVTEAEMPTLTAALPAKKIQLANPAKF